MKTVITIFFSLGLIGNNIAQVTNLSNGLWSNPAIWSTNNVPTGNDSVYLSYDITINVNASCQSFDNNGYNVTVNSGVTFNILGNNAMVDLDNNLYHIINIGTQTLLQSNLNVSHYRNGDPIPQVTDPVEWYNLATGAWCYYNNDSATYASIYGKIYNWYAVNDPRGLAPQGWHIPDTLEWNTLQNFLGGDLVAGDKLKDTTIWVNNGTGIMATNSSGFTALPGGYRDFPGPFGDITRYGSWWSSNSDGTGFAWYRALFDNCSCLYKYWDSNRTGFSVRCIKN